VRLLRSQLFVVGAIVAAVGLLITVLSVSEWRRQLDYDDRIRTSGTPVEGSVVGVIGVDRDGTPISVRVNYQYRGARQAEVDLAGYPSPKSLTKDSRINLLVAEDEPSFPRLVESVGGGSAAAWRNGAVAGSIVLVAGFGLAIVPVLRDRGIAREN
jgi:hypothetical protein